MQVEPARKLQDLSDAAHQLINTSTQQLMAAASEQQQQQQQQGSQACLQIACHLQESWDSYVQQQGQLSQATAAQDSNAPEPAGAADSQTVADTLRQLKQLQMLLQQLQQVPAALQHTQEQAAALTAKAAALIQQLDTPTGHSTAGRFEWVDGSLTRAIQHGTWVLLDNANLVNPTVLDRLNGLLEPHGVLQLDEAGGGSGGGRVVVPHPGFRLMLAYDPKHGEVSRAMRNRGVELFLLPPTATGSGSEPAAGAVVAGGEQEGAADQQQVGL